MSVSNRKLSQSVYFVTRLVAPRRLAASCQCFLLCSQCLPYYLKPFPVSFSDVCGIDVQQKNCVQSSFIVSGGGELFGGVFYSHISVYAIIFIKP